MASVKTKVTEIATALGIMGDHGSVASAMSGREPPPITNLSHEDWADVHGAYGAGTLAGEFGTAFANGRHFLQTELTGAKPKTIEWRGNGKTLYHHDIPVDIRVNRVYLVSCKYNSKVLLNPSPHALFDEALGSRSRGRHWYATVARQEYCSFYRAYLEAAQLQGYPDDPAALSKDQRDRLRKAFPRKLPVGLQPRYRQMAAAVARESARRWEASAGGRERDLLLRILRISAVDYFFLGTQRGRAQRLKLLNSADWNGTYRVKSFHAWPATDALQPQVQWRAEIETRKPGTGAPATATSPDPAMPLFASREHAVEGHVEIRWSHGKFCGNPEAKVYLDTPVEQVPGYEPF